MAVTIQLPQVGESVVEGTIGKWLKQPGDRVERFEPLVEVVTDKVTMEVPSPVEGSLLRILAQEGETLPMGAPIAEMETEESPAETAPPRPPGTIGYLVKDAMAVGPSGDGVAEETPPPPTRAPGRAPRPSPAVRRLAQERGVDLSQVRGTGLGGRITRDDLLRYIEEGGAQVAPAAAPAAPMPQLATDADVEYVPLTPVRRMIAQAMVRSVSQIPHAWSVVEADVSGLVALRNSLQATFQQREDVELTYLPFVIKAVVESLEEHPTLNASWDDDSIVLKKRIDLGIAVAAPEGLIVPVIHDADGLGIAGLARAVRDLTTRARQNKLTLADVQGGTFTLNNTGALGSFLSQPIINYPQAAILTTETIQKRAVVLDDAIVIRSIMNLCMSFDHRINDGSAAGAFIQAVRHRLESLGPDTPIN